jgi:hypothetical protein
VVDRCRLRGLTRPAPNGRRCGSGGLCLAADGLSRAHQEGRLAQKGGLAPALTRRGRTLCVIPNSS